jgi:hypothetical protein
MSVICPDGSIYIDGVVLLLWLSNVALYIHAAVRYFIMHLYKQSSHCQDVFDTFIQSSWWWTLSCSQNVKGNIIALNHQWKKFTVSGFIDVHAHFLLFCNHFLYCWTNFYLCGNFMYVFIVCNYIQFIEKKKYGRVMSVYACMYRGLGRGVINTPAELYTLKCHSYIFNFHLSW